MSTDKKQIKICMLMYNSFEKKGGISTRNREIFKRISKENQINVDVYFPVFNEEYNNKNIKYVKMPRFIYENNILAYLLLIIKEFKNIIKYDIIYADCFYALPLIITKKLLFKNYFVITTIHGPYLQEYWDNKYMNLSKLNKTKIKLKLFLGYFLEKITCNMSDMIFVISTHTKNIAIHHYHIDFNKIQVVPNGVDINRFKKYSLNKKEILSKLNLNFPDNLFFFIFVGRIDPRKSLETLINSSKIVREKNDKIVFLIIGEGENQYKYKLKQLVRDLDAPVLFLGSINDHQLPLFYNLAYSTILPSLSEGQGIVIMESMSCRTPVICSNISGVKDVITNNETGFIFSTQDYLGLSRIIDLVMNNSCLRDTVVNNAEHLIRNNYDWDIISSKILKILLEIRKKDL